MTELVTCCKIFCASFFQFLFFNSIYQESYFSIYDLTSRTMEMIAFFEAHESDIMCVEYSDPQSREF